MALAKVDPGSMHRMSRVSGSGRREAVLEASSRLTMLVLLASLWGCGGNSSGDGRGTVLVFAAASLTDVMADVEPAFEEAHPDLDLEVNVAGSATLREQVLEGAPADVFVSADRANIEPVVEAGLTDDPAVTVARNHLAIVTPAGNPGGVTGLGDFGRDELFLGLCRAEVPCGSLARLALDGAGVEPALDTEERDVRSLLTKVAAGELDAGIVYVTDATSAGDQVDIVPLGDDIVAEYPAVVLIDGEETEGGRRFVSFLRSDEGRQLLLTRGFEAP